MTLTSGVNHYNEFSARNLRLGAAGWAAMAAAHAGPLLKSCIQGHHSIIQANLLQSVNIFARKFFIILTLEISKLLASPAKVFCIEVLL